jgi:ubiquinone/menaquinone biosynthesis C-methylase UbiE
MLNLDFSKACNDLIIESYTLPSSLISLAIERNKETYSGPEFRIQDVFCDEIRNSLTRLGLEDYNWEGKKILDICCGTGYLSYHLSGLIKNPDIIGVDISYNEVKSAVKMIDDTKAEKFLVADALNSCFADSSFDVIIGNSFLHHFYDIPSAISKFYSLLRPGGKLIILHEPTLFAIPLEMGNISLWIKCIINGESAVNKLRYKGSNLVSESGGADIWILDIEKISKIFSNKGFESIRLIPQRLLRSLTVAKFSLHLSTNKKELSGFEKFVLWNSIKNDNRLSKIIPKQYFGSFCLIATKPI